MKKLRKDLAIRIRRGGYPSLTANLLAELNRAIGTGDAAKLAAMSEPEKTEKQETLAL